MDNYISRHDVSLFGKWSVNVVHTALQCIGDKYKYKFVTLLLNPHPGNKNNRFIIGDTFRKLSKSVDGFKWDTYFPCNNSDFGTLKSFISWLEKSNKPQLNKRKRKRKQILAENTSYNNHHNKHSVIQKLVKIHAIYTSFSQQEQQQMLQLGLEQECDNFMKLIDAIVSAHKDKDVNYNQDTEPPKKRRKFLSMPVNDENNYHYNQSTDTTTSVPMPSLPSLQVPSHSATPCVNNPITSGYNNNSQQAANVRTNYNNMNHGNMGLILHQSPHSQPSMSAMPPANPDPNFINNNVSQSKEHVHMPSIEGSW